jgi:hypothetical protein
MVDWSQENQHHFEYRTLPLISTFRLSFPLWALFARDLTAGGRDIPDIVEASEKERIEVLEAKMAEDTQKKESLRV